MNSLSALLLLAASVAVVSASGECSDQSSADAQISQEKELKLWAANVVADVVHAGMTKHSKHGAEGWVKSYQHSLAPAGSSGPELRANQFDKASLRASALGVSPAVCAGLCTAADVACELACSAISVPFLGGPCKAACGLAITACNGACKSKVNEASLSSVASEIVLKFNSWKQEHNKVVHTHKQPLSRLPLDYRCAGRLVRSTAPPRTRAGRSPPSPNTNT